MNPLGFLPAAARPQRVRQYAGASGNRLMADWLASGTSQDAETKGAVRLLRNRVRDLARNNDYVANALRSISNNVVGNGVKMQSQVKRARGPGSGQMDKAVNDRIEEVWSHWCRADNCHTAGSLSFQEIERLIIRSTAESGEVFVRLVRQKMGRSKVNLAIEIIEADLLDETFSGKAGQNEVRMGVELNEWSRPVAYHFFERHPGDIDHTVGSRQQKRVRVPAEDVIHLFRSDRPGQTRGVPWFASAISRLRHMAGFEEATVIAARAAACMMGFIESPDPEFEGGDVLQNERVTNFEPGKISTLAPGERFTSFQPTQPTGQLDPFMRLMLRGVSAGVGVSYEALSKDYSQSNYSSSRLALLDDRDTWRQLQQWLIGMFHQRVWEAWIEMATLSGALDLPGYETMPERYTNVRWIPRGWNWVDPQKEIAAYKTAVRSGFMTLTDVVAQNGGDFEEIAETRARELELIDELDLVFDTDPEMMTEQGQAQPEDNANAVNAPDSSSSQPDSLQNSGQSNEQD